MNFFGRRNSRIHLSIFGKTDVGQAREHNEDSFLVANLSMQRESLQPDVREHEVGPKGSLLIVADGMGGAAAGEVASALATKTVYEQLVERWIEDREGTAQRFAYRLREAVENANESIYARARDHADLRGMGTTITAVGILDDHIYVTQVGDSRAYLVRDGEGIQLTKDQSLTQRLVDAGELTEEEAERSERKNIILQALGPEASVRVDLTHQDIRKGDAVVLCSDGLSGQVSKEEIAEHVAQNKDLKDTCADLVALANERGGPDNITVVICRFGGDGLQRPSEGESVGHEVYPLLEGDSTEPVPAFKDTGPPPTERTSMIIAGAAAATIVAGALLLAVL